MELTNGKAPSVLNGGLENQYVLLGLGTFVAVGAVLEFELARRRKETPNALRNFMDMYREDDWDLPGNYGFDPLGFRKKFCKTKEARDRMNAIEIFNSRLAMLATVGYAIQEWYTNEPVIRETPVFFSPTCLWGGECL